MPGKLPLQGCTFVRDNLSYSGLVPGEFRMPVLTDGFTKALSRPTFVEHRTRLGVLPIIHDQRSMLDEKN